ncbi:hypothetical protein [Mobiluncus mulieris]|uniref:hypothetical protein n=1 Tax=Mobiluncus mulieris TaxID=2052 RepID=UPI0014703840|nr:hypothetical protein [Mobiluncus mulieris]NMX11530.1 hypothetical protein [Mobiluncus mulieris]
MKSVVDKTAAFLCGFWMGIAAVWLLVVIPVFKDNSAVQTALDPYLKGYIYATFPVVIVIMLLTGWSKKLKKGGDKRII